MLRTLRIRNLALVTDLTLELEPGYNTVTGETGAGKSILIGALNLVLGERADRTLIRSGCDACTVEAVFEASGAGPWIAGFLDRHGLEPCSDGQLLIKRTFTAAGANRQFINGSPATLNMLASLGERLVDIHGPHEHQSLLHPAPQLAILDAYARLGPLRERFGELVRQRNQLQSEKAVLIVDERTYAQQLDLLRFQVTEIEAARLRPDEEAEVEHAYTRASNAARLIQLCQEAQRVLSEDDTALLTTAGAFGRTLHELQRLDDTTAILAALHEQALALWGELQTELARYADRIDLDPARLQELEERLNLLHSLKRKYGATLGDVIEFGAEAARKLNSLEQRDTEVARLNEALKQVDADLLKCGRELSAQRRKAIPKLGKAVVKHLSDLGFRQSHFDVNVTTAASLAECGATIPVAGLDAVDFQFAPNPGEPARPLRAIASSGEMARVMLALKTVLAAEDEIPLLVFDEVDANVGGETAHAVGEKMVQIARQRQVICITHLAPVAASASTHYVVTKETEGGRTVTGIQRLDRKERVTELARMLGGQSDAARKLAESLLREV